MHSKIKDFIDQLPSIEFLRLPHGEKLPLPCYQTPGAAGMDLCAAVPEQMPIHLEVNQRQLIPTGFSVAVPAGFEMQIRPRSGLALKMGLTCLNTPGTIDSDYRGEIKVLLINLGQEKVLIERGMRIAQAVIAFAPQMRLQETDSLEATDRGAGGVWLYRKLSRSRIIFSLLFLLLSFLCERN